MNAPSLLLGLAMAALPLGLALYVWRWVGRHALLSRRNGVIVTLAATLIGSVVSYLEALALEYAGLSLVVGRSGAAGPLVAMFLFVAPVGEASKLACVWPLVRARVIQRPREGVLYAVCAGAGFAAADSFARVMASGLGTISLIRVLLSIPAHVFFAGLWGYALGSGRGRRGWFAAAWLLSVLLHAVYGHIVHGAAPGLIIAVAPLILAMVPVAWMGLRDIGPAASSARGILPSFEPPSIEDVRRALRRSNRPLMVHWILIGALVNVGMMIALVAASVFLARQLGIDFAAVDESSIHAVGPLVLLGLGALAAFPCAGYLIARASAATSVLEPALAAALAIVAVVTMLGVAAPVAIVFALAASPVAFALACAGAWFGLSR